MSVRVVAFEGSLPTTTVVSWGAAAVARGQELINPRTGQRTPISELESLVDRGFLTMLPIELVIESSQASLPQAAVCIFKRDEAGKQLRGDPNRAGGWLAHSRNDNYFFDLFASTGALRMYARVRASELAGRILSSLGSESALTEEMVALTESGLGLDPWCPDLWALRASYCPRGREAEDIMARAMLGERADDLEAYQQQLDAMQRPDPAGIELKFEGKEAGGEFGFEVGTLVEVLRTTVAAIASASKTAGSQWGHVPLPASSVRAQYSVGASVHLRFAAPRPGSELERVLWNLRFAQALRIIEGKPIRGGSPSPALSARLDRLRNHYADTVFQRRSNNESFREIASAQAQAASERDAQVKTLCYLAGLRGEGRGLELQMPRYRRIAVSGRDNGLQPPAAPEGAAFITSKSFMYRPFLVRLAIVSTDEGIAFQLRSIGELERGTRVSIDGFPSSLLKDVMVTGCRVSVVIDENGSGTIGNELAFTKLSLDKRGAHSWATSLSAALAELESKLLAASRSMKYFPEFRSREHTHLAVGLLHELGAPTAEPTLLALLQAELGSPKRMNNTQRIVRHKDLFLVEDGVVSLTARGVLMGKAMRRAGWRLESPLRPPREP